MDRLHAAWQEAVFALYLAELTQHIPPKGAHLIRYYIPEMDWESQTPLFRHAVGGLRGRRHVRGDLLRITDGVGCGDGLIIRRNPPVIRY